MKRSIIACFCLFLISLVDSYKILGLFPYPGKSHYDVFHPIMEELARKGHEVTILTHFPPKKAKPGFSYVSLEASSNKTKDVVDLSSIPNLRIVKYATPFVLSSIGWETCRNLRHPNVKKLLESDAKFDLILVEQFDSDCFLGFAHHYKVPFIGLTSHILMPWTAARIAIIDNPSYIPNHFMDFSDRMGFVERVENTVAYICCTVINHLFIQIPSNRVSREIFGDDVPSSSEIAANISLILANTHYTLNRPRPLPPSYIDIGGVHIGPTKNIPKNIEKWINESKDGVIYFSMGSMIKGHTFPEHKKQAFLRAFGRLKQRVLWKWENDTMPGKPDNVMIQKWMPQFDILCHPNVKGFVSHGGLLGTTEAVHCGVPVVVMPQFGDQHTNARALEAGGGGIVLDFHNIEEDTVYRALKTILDPEFNKKAKQLSERFRDRPMPPLETAIYWIEYVARHKGADHMRTAAVNMPFYQYLLLDVIAFLILALAFTIFIVYHTIRITCGMCCKKTQKVKKS
ncbi:PREDICTED: UDP-glucuronosyltransferase 1-7C-like isoform X3 [Nicrophorus vespilloides]|uniref:UDP-glucuronosyltransferase n=1 Tax=Nicrophorus vespilloides TaxID=110193 RepID=A0ABM1M345_NICVS|nr:PREDICTED: UDP-glucuronosyltransferase 1-7C-like isoform X3 [Nicrophorus vespilloides]